MPKAQVIKLTTDSFEDFLEEIRVAYREKRIEGFICIAQTRYRKGECPSDRFCAALPKYWFGFDSTVTCLGLLELMKHETMDYLREVNEDAG